MKRFIPGLLILLLANSTLLAQTRIAFGSCSQQHREQIWDAVIAQRPQLWVWLGDNIYGDSHNMQVMRREYDLQKAHPGYQRLMKQCPIVGTWDDHDYGVNDGGKYFSQKQASKEEFMRFIGAPPTLRDHEGVYSTRIVGEGRQKVKIILLDTRYFRDTLARATLPGHRYGPNATGDVLGEAQWQWLEQELTNSDAAVHIIGSSIQFLSNQHGYEKWGHFPAARERMLRLLQRTRPARTFFLSGDRHIAEISRMQVEGLPYPLYDFTSSGLTHTWSERFQEANEYRVSKLVVAKNFGMILIDWNGTTPRVRLQVHGEDSVLEELTLAY